MHSLERSECIYYCNFEFFSPCPLVNFILLHNAIAKFCKDISSSFERKGTFRSLWVVFTYYMEFVTNVMGIEKFGYNSDLGS